MQKKNIKKLILGAVGAFFISVLSSYLYDVFIKSFFINITTSTLNYFDGYRNKFIYEEVAKGFHDCESLLVLTMMIGVTAGLSLSIIMKQIKNKYPTEKTENKKTDTGDWIEVFFITIFLFIVLIQQSQLSLVNRLITDFNQKRAIATPYLEIKDRDIFVSDFAKIKTKEDYEYLMDKLEIVISNE